MSGKHNIGFVFIEEVHHLYHFITAAIELSKRHEVSIITFSTENTILHDFLKNYDTSKLKVIHKKTTFFRHLTDKLKGRTSPRKTHWVRKNAEFLITNFDALVFTDYYHDEIVKLRGSKPFPKLIKFPHGIPGREHAYHKAQKQFDFQLLVSDFHKQRLKEQELLVEHAEVLGYLKMDVVNEVKQSLFDNNNPTIIYNPHFLEPHSSFHNFGMDILKYFYNSPAYNLIFAPHINLFHKVGLQKKSIIPQRYFHAKNILIDLGSEKSLDMTYTKSADVYLGDVSSQALEFMLTPRPCIFINSTHTEHTKEFITEFWSGGPVVSTMEQLTDAVHDAYNSFNTYKKQQELIKQKVVYTDDQSTTTQRVAKSLERYLNLSKSSN